VQEFLWNGLARHGDIVLPCALPVERNDIGAARSESHLLAMKKAVEPPAMVRTDYEALSEIAGHLGFREAFTENRGEMEWLPATEEYGGSDAAAERSKHQGKARLTREAVIAESTEAKKNRNEVKAGTDSALMSSGAPEGSHCCRRTGRRIGGRRNAARRRGRGRKAAPGRKRCGHVADAIGNAESLPFVDRLAARRFAQTDPVP